MVVGVGDLDTAIFARRFKRKSTYVMRSLNVLSNEVAIERFAPKDPKAATARVWNQDLPSLIVCTSRLLSKHQLDVVVGMLW